MDGESNLHLFFNGVDQGVAARDVPGSCYGVVDLYGKCDKVRRPLVSCNCGDLSGSFDTKLKGMTGIYHFINVKCCNHMSGELQGIY